MIGSSYLQSANLESAKWESAKCEDTVKCIKYSCVEFRVLIDGRKDQNQHSGYPVLQKPVSVLLVVAILVIAESVLSEACLSSSVTFVHCGQTVRDRHMVTTKHLWEVDIDIQNQQ